VVVLLVLLAYFLGGGQEDISPEAKVWTLKDYQKRIDRSVQQFREKDYAGAKATAQEAVGKFDQNNAAHIMSSLAQLWNNKGDLYQTLPWGQAEAFLKELLDVHPGTEETKSLARDLLLWIKKEEPHVASLQRMIRLIEEGKWDEAESLAKAVPEDCKIKALYGDHIARIEAGRLAEWSAEWQQAEAAKNWSKATRSLERLRGTKAAPGDLEEKMAHYRDQAQQEKTFSDGKAAYDASRWQEAQSLLTMIQEGQLGYQQARSMLGSIDMRKQEEALETSLNKGDLKGAMEWIQAYFPDRKTELERLERLDKLTNEARASAQGARPEECVENWRRVLEAAGSSKAISKQAKEAIDHWTSPKVLAPLYLKRGKEAEAKEDYQGARNWYGRAREQDGTTGEAELKEFERQAWLHFNRAMVFDQKQDKQNTHVYLRKALDLIDKNSKLYDRIEMYTRQSLEK